MEPDDARVRLRRVIDVVKDLASKGRRDLDLPFDQLLDVADSSVAAYERAVVARVARRCSSVGSKRKSREWDELVARAEHLAGLVEQGADNVLPAANRLAASLAELDPEGSEGSLRLLQCVDRAYRALSQVAQSAGLAQPLPAIQAAEDIQRLLELGLGLASAFSFKVTVLGDSGVGKTSLIKRYVRGIFTDTHPQSPGTRLSRKDISFLHPRTGLPCFVTLAIWDLSGMERMVKLRELYCSGSDGALAVFDLANRATLDAVDRWLSVFRKVVGEVPVVIVGNKLDVKLKRIAEMELNAFAAIRRATYVGTSARTGEGVDDAFAALAKGIVVARRSSPSLGHAGDAVV